MRRLWPTRIPHQSRTGQVSTRQWSFCDPSWPGVMPAVMGWLSDDAGIFAELPAARQMQQT